MKKIGLGFMVAIVWFIASPYWGNAYAAAPFYEGKVIRLIVGQSAGGGFDTYSRAIARHMGKHIPGNPTMVVENMPGAATMISANHMYNIVKSNGLTVGNFISTLMMGQLLGQEGIQFDIRKFEWLGCPVRETMVLLCSKKSGITNMEKLLSSRAPVRIGGTSFGDMNCDAPKILNNVIGLPIKLVEGYKGTAEIRLAVEAGEVAGTFLGWESAKPSWRKTLESGDVSVVLQLSDAPHPDLPKVPLVSNFARTEEDRQLIKLSISGLVSITRLYALSPGTPKQQVQILRKAFADTMKDKDLLAEAEKAKIDINPVSAEEIEQIASGIFNLKPSIVARLKEILIPRK